MAVVAFFYLLRFSLSLSLFVSRFRVLIFRIVSLSLRIVDARAFRPFALGCGSLTDVLFFLSRACFMTDVQRVRESESVGPGRRSDGRVSVF